MNVTTIYLSVVENGLSLNCFLYVLSFFLLTFLCICDVQSGHAVIKHRQKITHFDSVINVL